MMKIILGNNIFRNFHTHTFRAHKRFVNENRTKKKMEKEKSG